MNGLSPEEFNEPFQSLTKSSSESVSDDEGSDFTKSLEVSKNSKAITRSASVNLNKEQLLIPLKSPRKIYNRKNTSKT